MYSDNRPPRFQRVKVPDKGELEDLVQLISQRVGRCIERQGLLEQDAESAWLDLDPAEDTDATPGTTDQSTTWDIASFRRDGFQPNSTPPAWKPVKTAWPELLRAFVQE